MYLTNKDDEHPVFEPVDRLSGLLREPISLHKQQRKLDVVQFFTKRKPNHRGETTGRVAEGC